MTAFILAAFAALGVASPDPTLVAAIAHEAHERPFVATNEERTAAVLVAIAYRESGGVVSVTGDHGSSFCAFQIHLGSGVTAEGWTGADLNADAAKCTTVAARLARMSWRRCGELPESERLAAYARGVCDSKRGQALSRDRMFLAEKALVAGRKAGQ